MNKYQVKQLGITPEQYRKIFYAEQQQRCQGCDNQIDYGHGSVFDKEVKRFFCRKCAIILNSLRAVPSVVMEKLIDIVKNGVPH